MNFQAVLSELLQHNKPFVAYRLPHASEIRLLEADTVEPFRFAGQDLKQEGFVVVPFDNERENACLLKGEEKSIKPPFVPFHGGNTPSLGEEVGERLTYDSSFEQLHAAIVRGEVGKAVLSRKQAVDGLATADAPACFLRLCERQASTFNYLLSLPETGVWVGASPELLLRCDGQTVETVALAGTKRNNLTWSAKEVEEQGFVADYIAETLVSFGIDQPQNETKTVSTNGIAHLQTVFRFARKELQGSLGKLAEALHPTPAVCGQPKQAAKQLILAAERHERSLYAGFLGRTEADGLCALYVNIRCLHFTRTGASLFVGGGITRPSTLQAEWDETVLKAESLLNIINSEREFDISHSPLGLIYQ